MLSHGANGATNGRQHPFPFQPPESERNVAYWRINGFPAAILIWTVAEWESLEIRPLDAQYYPCGIWCALRIE